MGLWVLRADGQQEETHRVETVVTRAGPNPSWSPDGRWLAYYRTTPDGAPSVWMVETGTWRRQQADLPTDAAVVAWFEKSP